MLHRAVLVSLLAPITLAACVTEPAPDPASDEMADSAAPHEDLDSATAQAHARDLAADTIARGSATTSDTETEPEDSTGTYDDSLAVLEPSPCATTTQTEDGLRAMGDCAPAKAVVCVLKKPWDRGLRYTSQELYFPNRSLIKLASIWPGQDPDLEVTANANDRGGKDTEKDHRVKAICTTHVSPQTGLAFCEASFERVRDGRFYTHNGTLDRTIKTDISETKWLYLDGTGTELVKFKLGTVFAAVTNSWFNGSSISFSYGPVGISKNLDGTETGATTYSYEDACQLRDKL